MTTHPKDKAMDDLVYYYMLDSALRECNKKGCPKHLAVYEFEKYVFWLKTMLKYMRPVLFPVGGNKLMSAIKGVV